MTVPTGIVPLGWPPSSAVTGRNLSFLSAPALSILSSALTVLEVTIICSPGGVLCHRQDTSLRDNHLAINLSFAAYRLHDLGQASVSSSIE